MYVLLIALLITCVRAQNTCSCSCCLGPSCQPTVVGNVNVANCSADMCLSQCRCTYSQCAANYPYGQVFSQCISTSVTSYNCQCSCCNTGTVTCIPTLVGLTTAPLCQSGSCAIECYKKYPGICVSDPTGQTQGTCSGAVTTTTPITTVAPWLGNICSCLYCQYGSTCSSNIILGISSAADCSSSACIQACQNRYISSTCSIAYLNQINGVCLNQVNGRTKCKCNCCSGYGCIDYELNINDTCTACYSKCLQVAPCTNTPTITYTCAVNHSMIYPMFSILNIILMLIIVVSFSSH